MWEALKQTCSKTSDKPKVETIVFLSEKKFREALAGFAAPPKDAEDEIFS
jgi:hypothetical protein